MCSLPENQSAVGACSESNSHCNADAGDQPLISGHYNGLVLAMRQFLNAPAQAPHIGCRNPFLQYSRYALLEVVEGRTPVGRFSLN